MPQQSRTKWKARNESGRRDSSSSVKRTWLRYPNATASIRLALPPVVESSHPSAPIRGALPALVPRVRARNVLGDQHALSLEDGERIGDASLGWKALLLDELQDVGVTLGRGERSGARKEAGHPRRTIEAVGLEHAAVEFGHHA